MKLEADSSLEQKKSSAQHSTLAPEAYVRVMPIGTARDLYNTGGKFFYIISNKAVRKHQRQTSSMATIAYRLFEIIFSSVALICTFPLMVVIGLIIKLESPGPALFFQQRLSKAKLMRGDEIVKNDHFEILDEHFDPNKQYWVPLPFRFVKFRTMYADARERFPELYNYSYSDDDIASLSYKPEEDPRVPPIAKWLRISTLDELPNFWSVLTGDLSLVGPRPELPEMLPNYLPHEMRKFTVNSGITGLSQINGRGRLTIKEVLHYDLEYVENESISLNLKIFFKTIWKVITHHGAF